MIFTFWTSAVVNPLLPVQPIGPIDDAVKNWTSAFPDFRVFGDDDVKPLLQRRGSIYLPLYEAIKIPACRSDVARLLLLHEYGGLYVDAHVGTGDFSVLARILERLSTFELILFDKTWTHKAPDDMHILNTFLCGRQRSEVVNELIESAFQNLSAHRSAEMSASGYIPYNIYMLTGAGEITTRIFDLRKLPRVIRPEFIDQVHVEPLYPDRLPFFPYKHYGYRQPGLHWSDRQQNERLFED